MKADSDIIKEILDELDLIKKRIEIIEQLLRLMETKK